MTTLLPPIGFVEPMIPALVDAAPEGNEWIHELKYDGYRTELALNGSDRRAYTRNGHDWTHLYRILLAAAADLPCRGALLDGEVIVQDRNGLSDFAALRSELRKRNPQGLLYVAFDLLHLNGEDLRRRPVEQRRERLRELIGAHEPGRPLLFSDHVRGGGPAFFALAEQSGAEGIVSKKVGSRYRSGAARSWVKTKAFTEDEFVVIGAAKGDLAPVALLARETEDRGLEYAGAAMVTFEERDRERFWRTMERLATETPPVDIKQPKASSWVRPEMRVRVQHLRGEEILRHATVKAISEFPAERRAGGAVTSRRSAPEPTYTVGAEGVPSLELLLDYYAKIGPWMLPFVASRPLNLFRCPPRKGGECVFQRSRMHPPRPEGFFPPPIRDVPILQKNGRTERYLYVEDVEGMLACVRAETVEFHGWGSRVDAVEKPDRIAIDLDPDEGLGFEEVKRTASEIRGHLADVGLESFPLLSGGKGVHVVVPLTADAEWPEVHGFAEAFCAALAGTHPDRFTVEARTERRRGRIFLDYLRNHRTATAVLPYSVRARAGAPVAAPVTWEELAEVDAPGAFTAADIAQLVKRARRLQGKWGVADQRLPKLG